MMRFLTLLAVVLTRLSVASVKNIDGFGSVKHVIMLGLDGLDVRCLQQALVNQSAPNIQYLRNHGVYTENARNYRPALSLPNWATIFYGAGVMFHGVTSNSWTYCTRQSEETDFIPPYLDDCVVYPDIFSVTKQQKPDYATAMYYTWANFDAILPNETVPIDNRRFIEGAGCDSTIEASKQITEEVVSLIQNAALPQFLFLYLDEVDECAHETSCFSDEGQAALTSMDANIGKVLDAVREAGLENSTAFLLVTDHGRNVDGNDHGDKSRFNFVTQWLVYGRGVIDGSRELKSAISIEDTAPTIAHLLGFDSPMEWHGRVVQEVFTKANESLYSAAKSAWGACLLEECSRKRHHKEVTKEFQVNWTLGLISTGVVVGGILLALFIRLYSNRRGYSEILS